MKPVLALLFVLSLGILMAPRRASPRSAASLLQTVPAAADAANPADVASIDAIMAATYDVISGPAGKKRDWNRFRSLFAPGGRLVPTFPKRDGSGYATQALSPDDYAKNGAEYFEKNSFFEREIARRTEAYGHIAQVFSTYESRHNANDAKPFERGINSFQLMDDGKRWWIVTIFWQGETAADRIPKEYLKGRK